MASITRNSFLHLERKWEKSPHLRPLLALAAVIHLAVSPILFLADGVRWAYRTLVKGIPTADYHYFYSTQLFPTYLKQLKEFMAGEVAAHLHLSSLDLIQWIEKPVQDKAMYHQGIVSRLRDLVIQKPNLPEETALFVERFCAWTYTGPQLLPAMTEWLKSHMSEGEKGALSQEASHLSIPRLHQRWNQEPKFQGEIFQDYRPYDPRHLGDTPSHFFNVLNTQIIRTPATTRDDQRTLFGTLTRAAIVEEFEGFLQHYQRTGKTHLYVNLMAQHGSEKIRTDALRELEKKYPHQLQLMTLSKDCAFYHQVGPFAGQNQADLFKQTFIQQMLRDNPAFHWPISWDLNAVQTLCEDALENVHAKYFDSAELLDREKRCTFIELAYTEIIESLVGEKNTATCNISCRSCVDRGATNLSLLYAKAIPRDQQSKETHAAITLAPAMISQSRQMLSHRMSRLAPALHLIESI